MMLSDVAFGNDGRSPTATSSMAVRPGGTISDCLYFYLQFQADLMLTCLIVSILEYKFLEHLYRQAVSYTNNTTF